MSQRRPENYKLFQSRNISTHQNTPCLREQLDLSILFLIVSGPESFPEGVEEFQWEPPRHHDQPGEGGGEGRRDGERGESGGVGDGAPAV